MRKIAIITDNKPSVLGGSEIWTGNIEKILRGEGHLVDTFTADCLPDKEEMSKAELPIRLAQYVNKTVQKYDAVISAPHYGSEIVHTNNIVFFHGTYLNYANATNKFAGEEKTRERLYLWNLQKVAALRSRVFCCSLSCKKELEVEGIKVEGVIEHGVDPRLFYVNKRNKGDRHIFPARYAHYEKGFDIIKELGQNQVPIDCYTQIEFEWGSARGHLSISREELAKKYRCAKSLVFPTRYEGAGLVTLEALASGIPVVTTKTGYGVDLEAEFPEFVVERNTAEEFKAKIEQVCEKDYSQQVSEFVKERFNYDKFLRKIKELVM